MLLLPCWYAVVTVEHQLSLENRPENSIGPDCLCGCYRRKEGQPCFVCWPWLLTSVQLGKITPEFEQIHILHLESRDLPPASPTYPADSEAEISLFQRDDQGSLRKMRHGDPMIGVYNHDNQTVIS